MTTLIQIFLAFLAIGIGGSVNAQSTTSSFAGLRTSLFTYSYNGSELLVTLRVENTSDSDVAIAAYPANRPLNSPVVQFHARRVRSGFGWIRISGLSFGESADEWTIIRPGGSVPVTYSGGCGYCDLEFPVQVTTEFKLYKFDNRSPQRVPVLISVGKEMQPVSPLPERR